MCNSAKYKFQHLSEEVKLTPETLSEYEHIKQLMYAGAAVITIQSKVTKAHYTYSIRHSKKEINDSRVYFVSLLHGPDNVSDYAYLGIVNKDTNYFRLTSKSKYTEDSKAVKAFRYFFEKVINGETMQIDIFHEGKCARCGRRLTTPESIRNGIGPECMNRI